jgi:hypothetical protein
MAVRLTRSDCEGSSVVDRIYDDMLWNDSAEDGDVRSECEDGDSDTDWYS